MNKIIYRLVPLALVLFLIIIVFLGIGSMRDNNYINEQEKAHKELYEHFVELEWQYNDLQNRYNLLMDEHEIVLDKLEAAINEIDKWGGRYNEYPVATTAWLFITREMGYSEELAAGIIGNMMAECGGDTLALNETLYNRSEDGGGLCGWKYEYFPEARNADLKGQLEVLANTIEREISLFGSFDYFLQITGPRDAALYFAKHYERPDPQYISKRARLASIAYNYFSGIE